MNQSYITIHFINIRLQYLQNKVAKSHRYASIFLSFHLVAHRKLFQSLLLRTNYNKIRGTILRLKVNLPK